MYRTKPCMNTKWFKGHAETRDSNANISLDIKRNISPYLGNKEILRKKFFCVGKKYSEYILGAFCERNYLFLYEELMTIYIVDEMFIGICMLCITLLDTSKMIILEPVHHTEFEFFHADSFYHVVIGTDFKSLLYTGYLITSTNNNYRNIDTSLSDSADDMESIKYRSS